jgi:Tfp pilus assembly protein PilX
VFISILVITPMLVITLQKGQIGLIVILIMVVGLTIGLAVASQSITNLGITETEEKSLRAFNAAEAGIESILQDTLIAGTSNVTVGGLSADVTVSESKTQEVFLKRNETMEVPLAGATATQVKISWVKSAIECPTGGCGICNNEQDGAPASLEIVKIRDESGSIVPYRFLYNSYGCGSLGGENGFSTADRGSGDYLSEVILDINGSNDKALRLRTFYREATIKVEDLNGSGLPLQEYQIVSEATTGTGETRSIEVSKTVEAWPPIFDYTLFSGSSLVK